MNQIELHKRIDELVSANLGSVDFDDIQQIILANFDTRKYFFTRAGEQWLDWLWSNGFLDVIKKKAEDITTLRYITPELDYLEEVSKKVPAKVVDIMLSMPISDEHFNPEVVDRFLWISKALPPEQLARMAQKIHDEQWPRLMEKFNRWGFTYHAVFETLVKADDWKSFLLVAEAILQVRDKKEAKGGEYINESPFYFNDIGQTKVFSHLASVGDEYAEEALRLATNAFGKSVLLGAVKDESGVFDIEENYYLFDVDFFDLEIADERHFSYRDDMRNLAATVKELSQRTIGSTCNNLEEARRLYAIYINSLPKSRAVWRLKMFVLSLCPEVFKEEFKKSFFQLFQKTGQYYGIMSGAEYLTALQKCFSVLSNEEKREYIKQVIAYFTKQNKENDDEKSDIHLRSGAKILSVIYEHLTQDEKEEAEREQFPISPDYKPQPSVVHGRGGSINPRAPITPDEFGNMAIKDIASKLSNEWTPENIRKLDKEDDFLRPIDAEGLGGLMQADIVRRFKDYLQNAGLFFNKKFIDPHYTYTFLRGIYDALRERKVEKDIDWTGLIAMFKQIIASAKQEAFPREDRRGRDYGAWLSNWDGVHSQMADVLKELLIERNGSPAIDFTKHRNDILDILDYLFGYPDPNEEDNKRERGEPFSTAINSVRGKAFEALTLFIYLDGKKYPKDAKSKISGDVKSIYGKLIETEYTYAVMFVVGHYLASFYYRDEEWMLGLLPKIFPKEPEKKDLYLAAWEGYLSADVYAGIFPLFSDLYQRAIELDSSQYTKREYFKNLDEGLAMHLALAFVYLDLDFDNPLFQSFWKTKNTKRHGEFISFIGRIVIARKDVDEFIKEHKISLDKLKNFWDWVLERCDDGEALAHFGYWVNPDKDVLELGWLASHVLRTLEKPQGHIEWEYSLTQVLPRMAEKFPETTFKIVKRLLLDDQGQLNTHQRFQGYADDRLFEVFGILYNNTIKDLKKEIKELINTLLPLESPRFWKFKEIIPAVSAQ